MEIKSVDLSASYGWICGKFLNAPFNAPFEVCLKEMKPGEINGIHRHNYSDEYTYVISGTGYFLDQSGKEFLVKPGDLIKISEKEYSGFKVQENATYNVSLLVIKTKSILGDKETL